MAYLEGTSAHTGTDRTTHFDVVVIGSSPLMLIEALKFAVQGCRVAIFERREWLGGAWYVRDLWDWGSVEVGCHFIENTAPAYQFMQETLDLDLQPMDPQPFMIARGLRLSRDLYELHKAALALVKSVLRRQFSGVPRSAQGVLKQAYLLARKRVFHAHPYLYPPQGCRVITDRLVEQVQASDIRVFTGCEIFSINIHADRQAGECQTSSGTVSFGHLLMNSSTKVENLCVDGVSLHVERSEKMTQHMVLAVKGTKRSPFTYVDLLMNKVGERVSDVGLYSPQSALMQEKGLLLLCVRVNPLTFKYDTRTRANMVLQNLVDVKLLNEGAQLLNFWIEDYDFTDIPPHQFGHLERELKPAVTILNSRDLGISLTTYANQQGRAALSLEKDFTPGTR